MANYSIKIEEVNLWNVEIEAEDEFEAEDIARVMWSNGELGYCYSDVSVIVED